MVVSRKANSNAGAVKQISFVVVGFLLAYSLFEGTHIAMHHWAGAVTLEQPGEDRHVFAHDGELIRGAVDPSRTQFTLESKEQTGGAEAESRQPGLRIDSSEPSSRSANRIVCNTSKGEMEITLQPEVAPHGVQQLLEMCKVGFFDQGIAFFRVNSVAIQFGADMGKNNRPDKIDPYPTVREEWIMDPNPWGVSDSAEDTKARDTHTWDRGTVAMIGGTQMLISRKTGGHTMGVAKHDSPVGKITRGLDIIDKLYNGYGNEIDNHKGPDQVALFKEGIAYIDRDFPLTDRITSCKLLFETD